MVPEASDLLQRLRNWLDDPDHADDLVEVTRVFDEFAREFTDLARACQETASWCRLAARVARGEDVPLLPADLS
jgi:hypothetical protein